MLVLPRIARDLAFRALEAAAMELALVIGVARAVVMPTLPTQLAAKALGAARDAAAHLLVRNLGDQLGNLEARVRLIILLQHLLQFVLALALECLLRGVDLGLYVRRNCKSIVSSAKAQHKTTH